MVPISSPDSKKTNFSIMTMDASPPATPGGSKSAAAGGGYHGIHAVYRATISGLARLRFPSSFVVLVMLLPGAVAACTHILAVKYGRADEMDYPLATALVITIGIAFTVITRGIQRSGVFHFLPIEGGTTSIFVRFLYGAGRYRLAPAVQRLKTASVDAAFDMKWEKLMYSALYQAFEPTYFRKYYAVFELVNLTLMSIVRGLAASGAIPCHVGSIVIAVLFAVSAVVLFGLRPCTMVGVNLVFGISAVLLATSSGLLSSYILKGGLLGGGDPALLKVTGILIIVACLVTSLGVIWVVVALWKSPPLLSVSDPTAPGLVGTRALNLPLIDTIDIDFVKSQPYVPDDGGVTGALDDDVFNVGMLRASPPRPLQDGQAASPSSSPFQVQPLRISGFVARNTQKLLDSDDDEPGTAGGSSHRPQSPSVEALEQAVNRPRPDETVSPRRRILDTDDEADL
mgnify:FL=1